MTNNHWEKLEKEFNKLMIVEVFLLGMITSNLLILLSKLFK